MNQVSMQVYTQVWTRGFGEWTSIHLCSLSNKTLSSALCNYPPPHLGGLIATYGSLLEYRVSYTGSRATVTLVYGDRVLKKGRWRKRRRAPAAAQGESKPTPSAGPPNADPPKKKMKKEVAPAPSIAVSSTENDDLNEFDTAICVTPYNRPDPPAFTSGPPDVSPIQPTAPVEVPARKTAVVKRKATTPPSATPTRPCCPTQPPKPEQPTRQWTLKASKLHPRFHQIIKSNLENVRQLISEPKHKAYHPLPTNPDEGDFAVHRVQVDVDINAVCVTIRRRGRYNQALLLKEMDNPTLHRVLKTIAGDDYRFITKSLAASPYRSDLPHLDTTDFIGSP
ncbi:uncharacterized protein LOC121384470 [Gigantopelta aegis]|uniref:uncharacterized protein LOC121384470 n=1 Tax=Gigantopelta aegis TaxID=1735272 RepID=UPI001B888A38|nr:uncharacterized protein LOC121384470 [Gigantopelta aegis]